MNPNLSLRRRRFFLLMCVVVALIGNLVAQQFARGQVLEWARQLGTSNRNRSTSVSADGEGSVYISGYTVEDLVGGEIRPSYEAFVSKYDVVGTLQWTRQLGTGTPRSVWGYGVSADGQGNVYISGSTSGNLAGGPNPALNDAFLSKYDDTGARQWIRQLGTAATDECYGVSADGQGNVYISGSTNFNLGGTNAGNSDAFLSKYDAAGTLLWTRQLGTFGFDVSYGVSADGVGNIYISGYTSGSLGGPNIGNHDAFVSKYDATGTLQWTRQLGTPYADESRSVSADGLGNIFISGFTYGDLGAPNSGESDAFVSKYDAAGTLQWTRQLGTVNFDANYGISVSADNLGNAYIAGSTAGSLGGPSRGGYDAFVGKFDSAGTLQWMQQTGTNGFDVSYGVSAKGVGSVYISGQSYGGIFLAKFGVPEPASATLLAIALTSLPARRRAASRK